MKSLLRDIEITFGIFMAVFIVAGFFHVLGLVLQVWSPIITFFAVAAFTLHTFKTTIGTDAYLSISGIALYAISWYLVHFWGSTSAQLICYSGFLLWLAAVIRLYTYHPMKFQDS